MSDEITEQRASARGRAVDRVQSLRNKLVTVIQDHPDEEVKAKARARLAELPKYDPGATGEMEPSMESLAPKKNAPIMGSTTPIRDAASAVGNKVAGTVERIAQPVVDVGHAATNIMAAPDKFLLDPGTRKRALLAYDRGFTGGVGGAMGKAADPESAALAAKTPMDPAVERGIETMGMVSPRGIASGAAGLAKRGLAAVPGIGRLIARAPRAAGAVVGAGQAAAGGAAVAGTQTLTSGGSIGDAGRAALSAATDPANLTLGAAGGAAQGAGASMRANNPDVQFLRQRGVNVSMRDPGSGGAMNSPMVQAGFENVPGPLGGMSRKVTEAGKGRVQRLAADATADTLEGHARAARDEGMAATAALPPGTLKAKVDRKAVFDEAMRMIKDPRTPEEVKAAINKQVIRGFFDKTNPAPKPSGILGPDGQPMPAPPRDFNMSLKQANDLKMKIQDATRFAAAGTSQAAVKPHFAQLSHEASQGLGKMGEINDEMYGKFTDIEGARKALGIPGKAKKPITEAQRNTLGNTLGRRGADTRSAGKDVKPELEDVLEKFPEIRQYVEAPELLQHRSNLEFGTGIGGGPVNKRELLHTFLRNIGPLQARALSPALEQIGKMLRAFGPASANFMPENLGEGERRRMEQ